MSLSDVVSRGGMTVLPLIGLVLFVTVFALVLVRTLRKGRRAEHDAAAMLPLVDERPVVCEQGNGRVRAGLPKSEVTL